MIVRRTREQIDYGVVSSKEVSVIIHHVFTKQSLLKCYKREQSKSSTFYICSTIWATPRLAGVVGLEPTTLCSLEVTEFYTTSVTYGPSGNKQQRTCPKAFINSEVVKYPLFTPQKVLSVLLVSLGTNRLQCFMSWSNCNLHHRKRKSCPGTSTLG